MRKAVKAGLITLASFLLLGSLILLGVMAMPRSQYETNTHEIAEAFGGITIDTAVSAVSIVPSENGVCSVACYEKKNATHAVSVENGVLTVRVVDERKWYERIFDFGFRAPSVTLYLPAGEYGDLEIQSSTGDVSINSAFRFESIDISESTGDVTNYASASEDIKIKTTTGNIYLENVSAGALELSVSTGDITVSGASCAGDVRIAVSTGDTSLSGIACKNLISTGSTGDLSLQDVIATERFSMERSTGDVRFEACDAAEIFIETDTGNVKGSLLSEKVFIVDTDTGKKEVPKTTTGGRCEITTDTGDIKIIIA